jgi:primosomal protein N' (replication factor Y)
MMLVPEIALTDQVVRVFVARFGEEVAVIHSRLSDGERHDEWRRLQTGAARIVVGARSAVFAPLRDIGLIAVDEEHESSYKQESSPRYHAARTAEWRAERFGATVVLGSATPSVETYHRTETRQIERIDMPNRIGERPLPEVRVIDMREELRARKALFSRELEDRMREALASKRQCILFLNRRGYSRFLLCRDCGEAIKCPNCAVSLTLHQNAHMLRCHHCAYGRRPPTVCPCCSGTRVLGFGLGTEKVEEEVNRLLPSARVLRMDRDTTTAKGSHGKLLGAFRSGQADVLIGTQMVAKGLDFSNVTVVGVVSADTSLHVPDFRAPERCFQLLTQVSGRAGRGDDPGVAVFQSFRPEHYAVSAAARHEYLAFYNSEIEFRRELRYPPFSRLAGFLCTGPTDADARRTSEALANGLRGVVGKAGEILGPSPAPLQRIKNRFRWRVALRLPVGAPMPDLCRRVLNQVPAAVRAATIADLDPQNMA